jgi:hypothetical protein
MDLGSGNRQALPSTTVVVVQRHPAEDRPQRGFEVAPSDVVGHQLAQQAKTRQMQTGSLDKFIFEFECSALLAAEFLSGR